MLAICCGCFAVYLAIIEIFSAVSVFNDGVQVRPALGIGPVLGLYFGVPGILGCSLASLVSNLIHENVSLTVLPQCFIAQLIYIGFMHVAWYLIKWRGKRVYPKLSSSSDIVIYIVLSTVHSVVVVPLLQRYVMPSSADGELGLYVIDNICMLLYVGIPLLYSLDRSKLEPVPLVRMRKPYVRSEYPNLTQRLSIIFIAIGVAVVLIVSLAFTVLCEYGGVEGAGEIIDMMYIFTFFFSIPVFIMLPLLIVFMERRFTKPVEVLVNDQRTFVPRVRRGVEKGATRADIDVSEEGIRPRYELRELYDSTNQMRRDTVEFAKELHTRSVERERVATELNIAQQIQLGSVPHDFTAFRWKFGLDIGSVIRPAKQVGGDFYDVFNVGAHDIAFIIGDVSGKGIPAALFMMRAQTLIRQQLSECADLGTAITLVNRKLCERNESLLFVTAFVCVLNTTTGEVRYVNAGHNPPVLNEHGRSSFLSCKPGLVLGAMNAVTYRQGTFNLHAGDGLVLYTDGVTEACDPDNNLFGDGRLLDTLNGSNMVDIQGRLNDVVKTVDAFSGTAPQADDITMLAFRWPVQVHHVELMPEEENLERLFAFLEPLCDRDGCTPRMMNGLMLVCEELFVNICRYGFPKEQKKPVIFECIMDDSQGRLQLTITDSGVAYNPLDYESEKIVSGKGHRIGGMGILLVRNNVDEIDYEHIDGENILHISKRYV